MGVKSEYKNTEYIHKERTNRGNNASCNNKVCVISIRLLVLEYVSKMTLASFIFSFAFHKSSRFLSLSLCHFEFPNDVVIIVTSSFHNDYCIVQQRRNMHLSYFSLFHYALFSFRYEREGVRYIQNILLMPSLVATVNPALKYDET